jgi:hypothetical protein
MDMMMSFWAGATTGGLAGTVFGQLIQGLGWLARRPKISIGFDESTVGCRVEKEGYTYFRAKITNTGRSSATDVQVLLAIDGSEIYNMNWSGVSSDMASIPSATYRFCDIYRLSHADRDIRVETRSDSKKPELARERETIGYLYTTSKNSATAKRRIKLCYSPASPNDTFIA